MKWKYVRLSNCVFLETNKSSLWRNNTTRIVLFDPIEAWPTVVEQTSFFPAQKLAVYWKSLCASFERETNFSSTKSRSWGNFSRPEQPGLTGHGFGSKTALSGDPSREGIVKTSLIDSRALRSPVRTIPNVSECAKAFPGVFRIVIVCWRDRSAQRCPLHPHSLDKAFSDEKESWQRFKYKGWVGTGQENPPAGFSS